MGKSWGISKNMLPRWCKLILMFPFVGSCRDAKRCERPLFLVCTIPDALCLRNANTMHTITPLPSKLTKDGSATCGWGCKTMLRFPQHHRLRHEVHTSDTSDTDWYRMAMDGLNLRSRQPKEAEGSRRKPKVCPLIGPPCSQRLGK